jgi:predicted DNA-binding transcriptional regulator AlpA
MKSLGQASVVGCSMFNLIGTVGGFSLELKLNDMRECIKRYFKMWHSFRCLSLLGTYNTKKGEPMFEELLEKINIIEKNMVLLLDLHLQQTNSLTTYNEVALFLGKTKRTIFNYIKESKLVRDQHYYINTVGKAVFIPKAIVAFKQSSFQAQSVNNSNACGSRVMHPIALKLLQGVA